MEMSEIGQENRESQERQQLRMLHITWKLEGYRMRTERQAAFKGKPPRTVGPLEMVAFSILCLRAHRKSSERQPSPVPFTACAHSI